MEKMHGKIFLNRKVFVTSVVSASPQKTKTPLGKDASSLSSIAGDHVPDPDKKGSMVDTEASTSSPAKSSTASNSSTSPGSSVSSLEDTNNDSDSTPVPKTPIGPVIREKMDIFDMKDKRKAEQSPEQDPTKKEKKRLKEAEKAQRKKDYRERKQISLNKE